MATRLGSLWHRAHGRISIRLGIRIDSFLLHPQMDEGLGYDSNVFGGSPQRGSWLVGTHPSLLVASDWSRDSLGAYFAADDEHYLDQPRQSTTNWTASMGGSLRWDAISSRCRRRISICIRRVPTWTLCRPTSLSAIR